MKDLRRKNPLSDKLFPGPEGGRYNLRLKIITDGEGRRWVIQRLAAERMIFTDGTCDADPAPRRGKRPIRADPDALRQMSGEELAALAAMDDPAAKSRAAIAAAAAAAGIPPAPEDVRRAARRARSRVMDFVLAEPDFTHFVTLTLDGAKIDRYDVKTVMQRVTVWLNNRVQRKGLKYLIVPEFHKDGAVHFHGFFNDALTLADSGTVIPPEGGRPIKRTTAKRRGLRPEDCKTVYNVTDWTLGFSSAIAMYGDRAAAAAYIAKYVTKEMEYAGGDRGKIGGRYFYHSSNLREPELVYALTDFETEPGYEFETPGGRFRVEYGRTEFCKGERLTVPKKGPFAAAIAPNGATVDKAQDDVL